MTDLLAALAGLALGFPAGALVADLTRDLHWRR